MDPLLATYFTRLEEQRHEFSSWVSKSPVPRQTQTTGPGQWSAAQVLYHLARVDQQVVASIEKRLTSGKPLRPVNWGTRTRSFLLNLFLKLPLKFKAPAAVREVPELVEVSTVIREWEDTRARLQTVLTTYKAEDLHKEVFFHPRSGMITLPQTLRFLVEHTEHHRRQMQRLLS